MAGAPASRLADARAGRGRRRADARRAGAGRRHRPQPTIPFHVRTHLPLAPVSYAPIIGGVAVAAIDGDGQQEIIVGAEDGKV